MIFKVFGYLIIGCFSVLFLPASVMFLLAWSTDWGWDNLEGIELFGFVTIATVLSVVWLVALVTLL